MIHYMTSEGLGSPWVGNELRIVSRAGVPVALHCMRAPNKIHFDADWAKQLQGSATVLYPLPPGRLVRANLLAPIVFGGKWAAALANALFGERENLRARVACVSHFFVACMWALALRKQQSVSHIHAQWAFSSASIAMYGAWLLGVPFSFTGHAVDLTRQRVALRDKIRRAKFIIAISNWHKQFYLEQADQRADARALADRIHVAYCGIYTDEMRPASEEQRRANRATPFTILTAGRLIAKKGFPHTIRACKVLKDRGWASKTAAGKDATGFRCLLAGSGPDEADLRRLIDELGVGDVVQMTGKALQQEKIPAFMHGGDVFTLACVWAPDGDVDGLPQLTMEAMGCGVPAVTTRLVGNPDLVMHERTGLLVSAEDDKVAAELADALERLMTDGVLRERLARAGRDFVLDKFDITTSLEPLLAQYRRALGVEESRGAASEGVAARGGATA
jgi:glycosyltransferase involved in cell wall biosynthesis